MMRKFLIIVGVLLLLAVIGASFFALGNYSDGFRAGNVVKFSNRGFVFKTGEGQLNLGGFPSMQPNQPNNYVWEFSVAPSNKQVGVEIEDAAVHGYRVKLHYYEKYITFPWIGDTKYHIYKVEKVTE
jgi:hypothetical protein